MIKNKLAKKRINFDIYIELFLILLFLFSPLISRIAPFFSAVDELLLIVILSSIGINFLKINKVVLLFPTMILLLFSYSLLLIVKNNLPITHVVQVILTSKFLIVFIYYYSKSHQFKKRFYLLFIDTIIVLFFLSFFFSALQLLLPGTIGEINADGRGIRAVTAGGIFFSRILYSEFLLVFIILILTLKQSWSKLSRFVLKNRYLFLVISLILLQLTYSRKEFALALILLYYLLIDKVTKRSKWLFSIILISGLIVISYFVWQIFAEINASTFTDKQIRLLIFLNALTVILYYFPFGSGPGTFGSLMSLDYRTVYDKFDVPDAIVGYGGERGPVFDLFLVSLTAEYGLGVIIFILMIVFMVRTKVYKTLLALFDVKKQRYSLMFSLFIISLFVPIFTNTIGYMIFIIFALLSEREVFIDSKNN